MTGAPGERPAPPDRVRRLAEDRAAARARGDYATADAVREEIAAAGWQVRDTPGGGFTLAPRPPFAVAPDLTALPDRAATPVDRPATVALLVDGWPDDLRRCVSALLEHLPPGLGIRALDLGDVDGAGHVLDELARAAPDRIEAWHVARPAGWGAARTALLRADTAAVHVIMETSTVLTGDAITPLLRALDDPGVVAAGWRGADPDPGGAAFHDAGPGEVGALLGYLFAVRRTAALAVGGLPAKARYYRNADLEFSLMLGDAGLGRLVVPGADLPVTQTRHRGYHDVDPAYRERESRRTYTRVLARLRARARQQGDR